MAIGSEPTPVASERLDSWKEIAAYLKRDVRTLQRWEKEEGLPVHRLQHGKQGSVYAHRREIDEWWDGRRRDLDRSTVARVASRWIVVSACMAVVTAVGGLWLLGLGRAARLKGNLVPQPAFQFSIQLADDGAAGLAVSPNGAELAFATCCTDRHVWRHSLTSAKAAPVPGSQGGIEPFWSPDGSRLAFFVDDKLKVSDSDGAPPATLCDARGAIWGGSWNANVTIVFSAGSRLFLVSASGGLSTPIVVTDAADPDAARKAPRLLPDGRHFIYYAADPLHSATYLGSVDSPKTTRLIDSAYPAAFAAPSHLMYIRGTALVVQRLNVDGGRLQGEASLLADDVAPGALVTSAYFAASDNGVLAFVPARARRAHLQWFDSRGKPGPPLSVSGGAEFLNPAISPDGTRVAVNRMDPQTGNWDIWTVDAARHLAARVTASPAQDADPVWSPNGTEIVFTSARDGRLTLYRKEIDNVRAEEPLLRVDDAELLIPTDWSRDGRFVIYRVRSRGSGHSSIWALPMTGDRRPVPLANDPQFSAHGARISPDGHWIAYSSFESGQTEVFVQRFMSAGPKTQISSGGGAHPRWSEDGRDIVYWAAPGGLAVVRLAFSENVVRASPARPLVATPIPNVLDARTHYDLARDGRILVRQSVGTERPAISVITNWTATLKTLTPQKSINNWITVSVEGGKGQSGERALMVAEGRP